MKDKFIPVNTVKRYWMIEKRKALKLSHRTIAPMIGGISYQHYGDIEAGRRNPSPEMAQRLAEFFEVDVEVFQVDRTRWKKAE